MQSSIFEEIYPIYLNNFDDGEGWEKLAMKYGFENKEAIRSSFRRERKKRNLPSKYQVPDLMKKRPYMSENKPRVAVIDIETLPMVVYTFGLFDQYIGVENVISDICLLSWAGKYLNESKMHSDILTPEEALEKNDKRIVQSVWEFISNCDIIIGHNWVGFDSKVLNTAFLQYHLPPLKYVTVDTYMCAKSSFRFSSNKLSFINQKLGLRDKLLTGGFELWRNCHEGNPNALKQMLEYNIGDVLATEEVFYSLRPYIRNMNVALYNEIEVEQCPVCGGTTLMSEGYYYTSAGKWESVRCANCKCVSRKKNNLLTKEKKKSLLINS